MQPSIFSPAQPERLGRLRSRSPKIFEVFRPGEMARAAESNQIVVGIGPAIPASNQVVNSKFVGRTTVSADMPVTGQDPTSGRAPCGRLPMPYPGALERTVKVASFGPEVCSTYPTSACQTFIAPDHTSGKEASGNRLLALGAREFSDLAGLPECIQPEATTGLGTKMLPFGPGSEIESAPVASSHDMNVSTFLEAAS